MAILVPIIVLAALLVSGQPCTEAHPAAPEPNPAVQWLDKLEVRGREIRSFRADIVFDKSDELLKDRVTRTGELSYLAGEREGTAAANHPRFAVIFRQLIADGKLRNEMVEFIFDGEWLVEKDHKHKRFEKRQVVAPQDKGKIDPLSIDGPFPLPLGQKREQVMRRFDATVVSEDDDGKLHLRLIPRPDAPMLRDQKKFDSVEFWFDRQSLLPVKVVTDEGAVVTTVTLSNPRANDLDEHKAAELFRTDPPKGGWRVEIKPWND